LDVDNVLGSYQVLSPLLLAPGESILVVRNLAAFTSRYGTGIRVAGEYSGALNNAGDHLTLFGPVGEPILDFNYEPDWYPLTDGLGFSLVMTNLGAPTSDWGLAQNWRASSQLGGSPGAVDAGPAVIPPIVVNEAVANTYPPEVDRIELFNPTSTNVNVGGWFLTDKFGTPQKFRIPDDTWISAGGFLVFSETNFNAGTATSFALDGEGDDVWLFSAATNGDLTGYVHGFHFGASDEGISFGRYVNGAGDEDFVAQVANTFGTTNAGPRVGPVVFSEIMYHPPGSGTNSQPLLEFVELQNTTAAPVPLFSLTQPTNTWRLRNAVDFDFPPNTVLAAGQRALVVAFNPATDPVSLGLFRSTYHVDTNALIFGPWQGQLESSDERIELRKPGQLTSLGNVPSVLVEAVHYRDSAPWPMAADGLGSSLQRIMPAGYGNEPTNWFAAGFSPGAANFTNQPPWVTLSSPAGGSVFVVPGNIALAATTGDADGAVVQVEFFADGFKVGERTNAPYQMVWTNVAVGTHVLSVGARDDSGNYALSAPVSITASYPSISIVDGGQGLGLSWPAVATDLALYSATNLAPPTVWTQVTNTATLSNSRWTVFITPPASGARFFRLQGGQ
jgi:hypothetical protein